MMHGLLLWMLWMAAPFWETKPAKQWNDEEMQQMLTDSPWAQTTTFRGRADLAVYLASAKPMRDAEAEYMRRYTLKMGVTLAGSARTEYEAYLSENEGKVLVIAIRNPDLRALAVASEVDKMVEESILKAGKKKVKMTGHFPPGESDPVLRMVFPRPSEPVKDLNFELYIPGVNGSYREASFRWKDLVFQGKPEM